MKDEGYGKLHGWFGLSYASWLTMPRVMIQEMPDEWQGRMAALLEEYDDAYPNQPDIGTRVQIVVNGKLVKTPEWLIQYRHPDYPKIEEMRGVTASDSRGEHD